MKRRGLLSPKIEHIGVSTNIRPDLAGRHEHLGDVQLLPEPEEMRPENVLAPTSPPALRRVHISTEDRAEAVRRGAGPRREDDHVDIVSVKVAVVDFQTLLDPHLGH